MRAFMEINNYDLTKINDHMQSYLKWVLHVHSEQSPNGIDVRGEVKFILPDGEVTPQPWCRPQNDGPALRALSLTIYANTLIKAGQMDQVKLNLWTGDQSKFFGGAIKNDLDYVS